MVDGPAIHPAGPLSAPIPDRSVAYQSLYELIAAGTTSPGRAASKQELKEAVEQALAEMPEDYASAIRVFDLEGCTGPEAAQRLGRSRGAAFMLLARARERLREVLGSGSGFFSDRS